MGREVLVHHAVFVDTPMRLAKIERQESLADRKPLKRRHTYLDQVAATYDNDDGISDPGVVDPAVSLLAEFARGGRVLEFAVGVS